MNAGGYMGLVEQIVAAARISGFWWRAGLGLAMVALWPCWATAQTLSSPPPVFSVVDANGVNLATGTLNVVSNGFTIGSKGSGLSYVRSYISNQGSLWGGWTDNLNNILTISGSTYIVSFGGQSESFTLSGGVYTPAQGQGSALTYNSAQNYYTYTAADGTVVIFGNTSATITSAGFGNYIATQATSPTGVVTTFSWQLGVFCGLTCSQQTFVLRLQGVSSTLGWSIVMSYASNATGQGATISSWIQLTKVQAVNNAYDYCYPGMTCGTLSTTYPSRTFTAGSNSLTDTDALNRATTYTYGSALEKTITSVKRPSGMALSVTYNSSNQVQTVSNGTGTWTYGYSAVGSTETTTVTDPLGHVRTYVANLTTGQITSVTDYPTSTTSRTTSYAYDPTYNRLTQITYPLGDEVQYAYDARGNVTTVTHVPVSGSGLSNVVTSASFDTTCTNPVKCNEPNTTTDGNGKVTNYTYDTTYGVPTKVDPPLATTGATQSETRYSYANLFAYYYNTSGVMAAAATPVHMLTGVSTCQTETPSTCPGTADEVKTAVTYGTTGVANNLLPTAVSKGSGSGSLTATASQSYDQAGDPVTYTGPLGSSQKTVYVYDFDRERLGVFGPQASATTHYPTSRTTYNTDGLITEVENGYDTNQNDSTFATFTSQQQRNTVYDGLDRVAKRTLTSGGTTYNVTQLSYDNANRQTCSVVRMNPAVFGSLPSDACSLYTEGPNGNDRITQNSYDNADQLTQVTVALHDAAQATYSTYTYDPNGKLATVLDANNNLTTNLYDGLDRLVKTEYPLTTKGSGASDTTDYEAYTYDSDGNRLTVRRRSGDTITFTYDALSRVTEKTVPSWSGQNVFYGYDLLNRMTAADYGSLGGSGVSLAYDALSRKTGETAGGRTIASQYDLAGDRTRITWPDSMYEAYVFDVLQRPTSVEENGATSGIGLLATFTYDTLGRLTGITRGNGANTTIGYDGASRITPLAHSFVNTAANVSWTFTYDAANGVLTRTATNDAYTSHPGALSLSYTPNGLNQYSSVSGTTYSYDTRGNLTSDTARTFTYDVDNKLLTGSAPTAATFTYDPLGRMQTDTASGAATTFLYDGDNLSAEYNTAGAVLRRYAPSGLGIDQPLVWYEGSGTTSRQWLHADNQGSIAAYSNASGDQAAAYGYSPYGEPGAWSGSRYSYTGQLMIPESLLYNYKARAYDPKLGRFLQTDPSGQDSDVNLYAYVANDVVNRADPRGLGSFECPPTCTAPTVEDSGFVVMAGGQSGGTSGGGSGPKANSVEQNRGIATPINGPLSQPLSPPIVICNNLASTIAKNIGSLPSNVTSPDVWNDPQALNYQLSIYQDDLHFDDAVNVIALGVGGAQTTASAIKSLAALVRANGSAAAAGGLEKLLAGPIVGLALTTVGVITLTDANLREEQTAAIEARLVQLKAQGECPVAK